MITTRQDFNFVVKNLIDEPMLVVNSSRPTTFKIVSQRFGFADASKRFALDLFNQINYSQSLFAILFYPPRQIFAQR